MAIEFQANPALRSGILKGTLLVGAAAIVGSLPYLPDWGIHFWDYFTLRYSELALLADAAYLAASWQRVRTDQVGGITVFEVPTDEVSPGWKFVPFLAGKLLTVPVSVQEVQFPGDPEQISKRADRLGLKAGEFRPMRIMTGPGRGEVKDDILNERTAVEMTFSVRWCVKVENFFDFWLNTPGRTWEEKEAAMEQQMRDTGESDLTEKIALMYAGEVTSNIKRLNDELFEELVKVTSKWGITILECRVQSPDYGERISAALAGVPEANAKAKTTRVGAEAAKFQEITASEGKAQAIENLGRARGMAIAAGAKAAGIDVATWRNGELAKKLLPDKTFIVGEDGIAKAVGIGKMVTEALK